MTAICTRCGTPAVTSLAIEHLCGDCYASTIAKFDPAVFAYNGRGIQTGQMRPEHGPHAADLRCCACHATWVGTPGEPCAWCARSYANLLAHQADLVLEQPDIDPDDSRSDQRIEAWVLRLAVAVDAGIVDEAVAARAISRAIGAAA